MSTLRVKFLRELIVGCLESEVQMMNQDEKYSELAELAYLVLEGKVAAKEFLSRKKSSKKNLDSAFLTKLRDAVRVHVNQQKL